MDRFIINDVFGYVVGLVAIGCFTGIMITWLKLRARKSIGSPDLVSRLDAIAEHITRLDTAIDAMSVEVERISEGQRFTTKLLAERSGAPALAERSRAVGSTTPH